MTIYHKSIELGSGVFEKPQALGDFLVQKTSNSTLVICPNTSDVRFVENILRRRALPARRISALLDESDLNQIISWLENQSNLIVVCSPNIGEKIAAKWGDLIVCYSPFTTSDTYIEIVESRKDNFSVDSAFVSLLSPAELPSYVPIKKTYPESEVLSLLEQESINAQKEVLDQALSSLPARGSTLATELTKQYAQDLGVNNLVEDSEEFTTLKKFVTFFLEQFSGSGESSSIEEELEIIKETSQDFIDNNNSNYRDRRSNSDNKRDYNRNNRNNGSRHNNSSRYGKKQRDSRDPRDSRNRRNKKPSFQHYPIRLYVGLGSNKGLKPHQIKDFIADIADVNRDEIGYATVRSNYSFVDVSSETAQRTLEKESGYEYEGKLITVERALTTTKRNHNDSKNRGKNTEEVKDADI